MITLTINGKALDFDIDPATPILWVIREQAGLTGTKFGCGIAVCGACTVHLNGMPIRSCVTPVQAAAGQEITTIEGLGNAATGCTRYNRPGLPSKYLNAVTVSPGRLWLQWRYSAAIRHRMTRISIPP